MSWAGTVAVRLSIDDWRRSSRRYVSGAVVERPGQADVGAEAVHRVQLSEVAAGMSRLTPAQRDAIVSAVSGMIPQERSETVRQAVNRRRGRLRLLAWTDGVAAGVARVRLRLRAWTDGGQPALAGLVPYVAAVGLIVPLHAGDAPVRSREQSPAVAQIAVSSRPVSRRAPPAPAQAGRQPVAAPEGSVRRPVAAKNVATVPAPDGGAYYVATRSARADDALACIDHLSPVPKTCVGKPVRLP